MNNLNELSKQFHERAKVKGFWDKIPETGTLLMLIVSELSEALEADRKGKFANMNQFEKDLSEMTKYDDEKVYRQLAFFHNIKDSFEDEIADAFIRLFDLCGALDIDIEKHIELKMQYNQTREYKHGKQY